MADISTKLKQLRSLYSKMPEGGGKQAVAQKIAKLEASQPKEVVEVKEEVKEEVIKKPKAPKKTSKGKEMRHVFEKKVDGGKEVKVVMATSVDLAKEAMQESGFDYNRTISRGRSPKEGFVASGKPKKIKETKGTKRPTKATRDEMAKAAGMTPEKAEKVAKKVSSAKKRGRKPAKHNSYLFEMPMKTQAGKVKRKVIVATSEESAQKQAGRNYTFIKELKAGEKPKTGIQSVKDFVAPPPKKRGRRPRPKTQAEMDRMSDLYSKLGKKVKGQKSKKSKVAKKPKAPKKTSKSSALIDLSELTKALIALKKLAGSVKEMSKTLALGISELDKMYDNFSKNYAKGGSTYAHGGAVEGRYESIYDFIETNNLEEEANRLFGQDWEADDDMEMIRELAGVNYDVGEIDYETERDERADDYIEVKRFAKGGSTYAEGGYIEETESYYTKKEIDEIIKKYGINSMTHKSITLPKNFNWKKAELLRMQTPTELERDGNNWLERNGYDAKKYGLAPNPNYGKNPILLKDAYGLDDEGYFQLLSMYERTPKTIQELKEFIYPYHLAKGGSTYAEGGGLKSNHYFNVVYKNVENGDVIVEDEFLYYGASRDAARKDAKDFLEENKFNALERLEEEGYGSMDEDEVSFEITD